MISISIVTYNDENTIGDTLDSLLRYLPKQIPTQLFLVDNCSRDETPSILHGYASRNECITFIQNTQNKGYGAGHNVVIPRIRSRYHLICNPDILFKSDVCSTLAEVMDSHKEVGIIVPKFSFPDGRLQPLNHRDPTILDLFLRRFVSARRSSWVKDRLDFYVMKDKGYEKSYDVPFLSGAFMFCRTAVLRQIGGFDDRYFLYFEDADLSKRIRNAGYRTVYFPTVEVVHTWERAAHKRWLMTWFFILSAFRYFNKWGYKVV